MVSSGSCLRARADCLCESILGASCIPLGREECTEQSDYGSVKRGEKHRLGELHVFSVTRQGFLGVHCLSEVQMYKNSVEHRSARGRLGEMACLRVGVSERKHRLVLC